MRRYIETIEVLMKEIRKEYEARTMRPFDRNPEYVSFKDPPRDLLHCVVIEKRGTNQPW